jgi:hypothetical protein
MKTLQKNSLRGKLPAALVVCLTGLVLLLPRHSIAQSVTLTNLGSTAIVDLGGSDGLNSWTVDTSPASQVDSEWFYYSVNGGPVQPINSLGSLSYTVTGNNVLDANYHNSQLSIGIEFTLAGSGSGSGSADLSANNVTATSMSSGTLASLKIYEYANFNLLQSYDNSINISQGSSGPPFFTPQGYNGVTQNSGATALTEAINNPNADFAEAGQALGVLGDVTSGGNLNDNLSYGPIAGQNVAWAFEWSYQNVAPGDIENVLEDQTLSIANVPEPTSMALIALGLGACGFKFARRRLS